MKQPTTPDTRKPSIQWDEATIAEHNQERGTRMKIDEAKTPWHGGYSDPFSRLPIQNPNDTCVTVEEAEHLRFVKKRAQHYAIPKEKLQEALRKQKSGDDEDEGERLN